LDQEVALGDQGHEREPDLPVLALDDALDVLLDLMEGIREPLPVGRSLRFFHAASNAACGDGGLAAGAARRHLTGEYARDGRPVPLGERSDEEGREGGGRRATNTSGRPARPLFATKGVHRRRTGIRPPPSDRRLHRCDSQKASSRFAGGHQARCYTPPGSLRWVEPLSSTSRSALWQSSLRGGPLSSCSSTRRRSSSPTA